MGREGSNQKSESRDQPFALFRFQVSGFIPSAASTFLFSNQLLKFAQWVPYTPESQSLKILGVRSCKLGDPVSSTSDLPKLRGIGHQQFGADRRRKLPCLSRLLLDGGVGPGDGLGSSPHDFGNTPLLGLRNTLNLSIELVRELDLSANHEMIIQRLKNVVNYGWKGKVGKLKVGRKSRGSMVEGRVKAQLKV